MARLSRGAGATLARTLAAAIGEACRVVVARRTRRWASGAFAGERHRLRLRIEGERAAAAADALIAGLREREFDLPGAVLADIAVVDEARSPDGRAVRLALEALTVAAD